MWQIQWKDEETHSAESVDEVNAILDTVHQERMEQQDHVNSGCLVQIVNEQGEVLLVGLGRPSSVLAYVPADGWPSKSSRNEQEIDDGEVIVFFKGSHWSEVPKSYAVPVEQARDAVTFFCETGELSPNIKWVDD